MQSEDVETPIEVKGYQVLEAIRLVSEELAHEGISKDRSNQQQGYKFRGIDDCLNALASLLPKHGLVISPTVLERECIERQTKSGGCLFYVTVKVRFTFHSVKDGSGITVVMYGEAMDSADKATNKAMSAAYKYAVLLTFCIPTEGEKDADAVTHEVVPTGKTYAANRPSLPPHPILAPVVPPAPSQAPSEGFIWQVGKTHGGKKIGEIPLDYLTWFAANGKNASHVEACKAELARVAAQNEQKISALCEAYLENISMSETVSECNTSVTQALADENLNVFEGAHVQETGDRKLTQLRQA